MDIDNATFNELKAYYDDVLNISKSTYKSSNDENTPIDCVIEMVDKIPEELWSRNKLDILDPCCGNGNFHLVILYKLLGEGIDKATATEQILHFNDINEERLKVVENVFCGDKYNLQITSNDFLSDVGFEKKYDLIVANPPYAKILSNGKRASKNHNLIKLFIEKALSCLKENGYILFITPSNWMSLADRNILIKKLTALQIIHLDIHSAKRYFKRVGSSFTYYVIQNRPCYKDISVSGVWKKTAYKDMVASQVRDYIPLLYNGIVQSILLKTIDNKQLAKFPVQTSSDLHKYTKAKLINVSKTGEYLYRLIHTPKQTVYAIRPHKFQDGYKVFISTTDKYKVFVDDCGMTQSIAFIRCDSKEQAERYVKILSHPLYVFINNICRWGNFNNIRILQRFPIPEIEMKNNLSINQIYEYFNITEEEKNYISINL